MCTVRCIIHGIIAGIIAGIVFAFFLLMGGMTETVGAMIGMPTKFGGLLVHAGMSIAAGIGFALVLGWLIHSWLGAVIWGLLFGIGMWFAGPMTLLPYLSAGVPIFSKWNMVDVHANMPSLVGHLVFGFVLGIVYYTLKINQARRHMV